MECVKEEYTVGKIWTMDYHPGSIDGYLYLGDVDTNFTFLEIIFMNLKQILIKEKPVYTMPKLFGTIGGILGLYMGISVISLFEIAEMVCDSAFHYFAKCFRFVWLKTIQPVTEEDQTL